MSDKPIMFATPMVRALLDGRKTQTRRVLRDQPDYRGPYGCEGDCEEWGWEDEDGYHVSVLDIAPNGYRVGDRLWVREAWRASKDYDAYPPREMSHWPVHYEADGDPCSWDELGLNGRLRPSIFMPRWASRLTLVVTDVRVQRLQEISSADAIAEGCHAHANSVTIDCDTPDPRDDFRRLWDSLNAKRGAPWSSNPWVAALTFIVHHGNIDQMGAAE